MADFEDKPDQKQPYFGIQNLVKVYVMRVNLIFFLGLLQVLDNLVLILI